MAFFFAMMGQFLVRSYLAFDITDSAFALGIVNVAVALPMFIVAPLGGVVADRVERRNLIILGQLIITATEGAILALLLFDALEFWHLAVTATLLGFVFPFMMPARQAIVANIVGRRGLGNAMALQMGGMNSSRVVAPVSAGLLIAIVGPSSTYFVALVLYGIAFFAMTRVSRHHPERPENSPSIGSDMMGGFRYVQNNHPVRALLLLSIVPAMLAMPFQTLLVVFAEDVWHVGEVGFGVLQAAAGVGGVIGSAFVAWSGDRDDRLRRMMASLLLFGGTLFLFTLSPWFLLALPLVLIADAFVSVFMTLNNTAIQILIPDEVRGRVNSFMMMVFGITPLGTVPMAIVADVWGAPIAVGLSAVIMTAASVIFYLLSQSLRDIDQSARDAIRADDLLDESPEPAIPAEPAAERVPVTS